MLPAEPDDPQRGQPDDNYETVPAERRLRAVLRDLGIGASNRRSSPEARTEAWTTVRWTTRDLDELSQRGADGAAGRVSYATWARLIGPVDSEGRGYLCDEDTFVRVLATLARAKVPPTKIELCKQAYVAGRRVKNPTYGFEAIETGASGADLMVNVVEGLADEGELEVFARRFMRRLPPAKARKFLQAYLDAQE